MDGDGGDAATPGCGRPVDFDRLIGNVANQQPYALSKQQRVVIGPARTGAASVPCMWHRITADSPAGRDLRAKTERVSRRGKEMRVSIRSGVIGCAMIAVSVGVLCGCAASGPSDSSSSSDTTTATSSSSVTTSSPIQSAAATASFSHLRGRSRRSSSTGTTSGLGTPMGDHPYAPAASGRIQAIVGGEPIHHGDGRRKTDAFYRRESLRMNG